MAASSADFRQVDDSCFLPIEGPPEQGQMAKI
jgi:hypothetical protein